MAGVVTLHYVRFDRHQRGYSYIYRLFITVVTSSNAMGSDLYWPCFDIPVWVTMLILLGYYINSYIPPANYNNYLHSLVISSTIVFVFSITIVVTGVLVVHNRKYLRRLKQLFRSRA